MLNFFIPHVQAAGEVESMKILDWMNDPVSFTSLVVMQPRRKVKSDWMAGSARLSRLFM